MVRLETVKGRAGNTKEKRAGGTLTTEYGTRQPGRDRERAHLAAITKHKPANTLKNYKRREPRGKSAQTYLTKKPVIAI